MYVSHVCIELTFVEALVVLLHRVPAAVQRDVCQHVGVPVELCQVEPLLSGAQLLGRDGVVVFFEERREAGCQGQDHGRYQCLVLHDCCMDEGVQKLRNENVCC